MRKTSDAAIVDGHDAAAFASVASLTGWELRDWLLSDAATTKRSPHWRRG